MNTLRVLSIVLMSAFLYSCGQVVNRQVAVAEDTDSVEAVVDEVVGEVVDAVSDVNTKEVTNDVLKSDYHLDFPEYGFSIDTPCTMEDVSSQASGDFLLNYGGITDGNSREKMAAYQLIVSKAPIGYRDLPKDQYEKMVDDALRSQVQRFRTYKAIRFSYDELPGYVCETNHNGYGQKGIMFAMDNYIIALTVISNDNLEAKFNKFTNGFKRLSSKQ